MKTDNIYIIKNTINDKVYIGQTKKTIKERFDRHLYDSTRVERKNIPLYLAFSKYGPENFYIELIEQTSELNANNREKYYIEIYDSYRNGYNATLGGESRNTIDIPIQDIIDHYLISKSCRTTAKHFNIDKESVSLRVKASGLELFDIKEQFGHSHIIEFPDGTIKHFTSFTEAADYLINIKYPMNNVKKDTIRKALARANKNKTVYYNLKVYTE